MAERQSPYSAFNFLVEFNGVEIGAGFSDVSGLSTDVTIAEYREGTDKDNHVRKIPGMHKVGDITLKRGIIDSASLWEWVREVRQFGVEAQRSDGTLRYADQNRYGNWREPATRSRSARTPCT